MEGTIQFTPYQSPQLSWTSEQFDFVIGVSKPDKKGIFELAQVYLLDYFEDPQYDIFQHASIQIGTPEVLKFLFGKLFGAGDAGIELKSKYRSWPNLHVPDKLYSLPLTARLIRATQRRFYFNRSFWRRPSSWTLTRWTCKYALLSPTAIESVPQCLTNLIDV
jgi:hypothetical protein